MSICREGLHTEIAFIWRRIGISRTPIVDGDGGVAISRQRLLHHRPNTRRRLEAMDEHDSFWTVAMLEIFQTYLRQLSEFRCRHAPDPVQRKRFESNHGCGQRGARR